MLNLLLTELLQVIIVIVNKVGTYIMKDSEDDMLDDTEDN